MDEIYAMTKLLGYEPHQKLLSMLMQLARADEESKENLVKHGDHLTHLELLLGFDDAERVKIVALLSAMRLTFSQLRDILQLFLLARVKEGKVPLEGYASSVTADELKLSLKKRTHPLLSSLEQRLKDALVKAALPPSVTVKADPFFEKESIEISVRARDIRDVEQAIRCLDGLITNGSMGSIFELTKGKGRN